MTRHGALDQSPESRSVIHVTEMRDLMRSEIVEYKRGREHEAPGEGERTARRARSPARGLVAHEDPLRREIEAFSVHPHTGLEIEMRLPLQPVEQAARRVPVFACNIEPWQSSYRHARALWPGRRSLRVFRFFEPHDAALPHRPCESEHMSESPQRHDGAMRKRDRL
jgi:hypothetical protein